MDAAFEELIGGLSSSRPRPFALLYRPAQGNFVELLRGSSQETDLLENIPLRPEEDVLVVVPYRQLAEAGLPCIDDDAPLITLRVVDRTRAKPADAVLALPDDDVELTNAGFDLDDQEYAEVVRTVLTEKIGRGHGSNFVVKRTFTADLPGYSLRTALSIFSRLLTAEQGAHWTFLVHTGERTFVGASPELHLGSSAGTAVMNPISGTYRYPPQGPALPGLLRFLADGKEIDELNMVLDEELKMMAALCPSGGVVSGPRLREMTRLAHTEYLVTGRSDLDPREQLGATMFAPTVVGSPVRSAFDVIAGCETEGRGYYSGVLALIETGPAGEVEVDSAIFIRAAEIDAGGRLRAGVGATLVRHSDPETEVGETHVKIAGLLSALGTGGPGPRNGSPVAVQGLSGHPAVVRALSRRAERLSAFWRRPPEERKEVNLVLAGRRVLVVDAEDGFTAMLCVQLSALGLDPVIRRHSDVVDVNGFDLVVLGPGPGDPLDRGCPRVRALRAWTRTVLNTRTPLLSVCLSHQILSALLGLRVERRRTPSQGEQREITLFGTRRTVGFYNTFSAVSTADLLRHPLLDGPVEVVRDHRTGEVHALRGNTFASLQFHPESVLTLDGPEILGHVASSLLAPPVPARCSVGGRGAAG
ncbi:anthranilate synthase family protein [Lentzea sp. NEAU-D7]|uniref:anthranilate synthase family protein n=1 Tax=Lentzea sp. NEAU-D7 TaxID=2994667 RepID=UPI00224B217F|nr:anthranilate synthase family protein [Lentzea sp. NEAU-D7]MCX2954713.1 anthranilate synthase family protein [Lentzea sp. NEAU-D7]